MTLKNEIAGIIVAALHIRHNSSKLELEHHLKLLNIMVPGLGSSFASPYKFLKKYEALKNGMKKLFFCAVCSVELLCELKTGNPIKQQPCGHKFSKSKACYAVFIPIESQIAYYIKNYHQKDSTTPINEDELGDVTSGEAYKDYVRKGIITDRTITLGWNLDAAQVHENSPFNFMPCMGIINEAKYKVRRSNVILFAIWYGDKKPKPKQFLIPCVEMLKKLYSDGFVVNEERWYVRLLIISVDTIERCVLRCTSQFNGLFGCDFCLIVGNIFSFC